MGEESKIALSSVRCLVAAFCFILSTLAQAAQFHVRTDGSDSACNGLANVSSASAPACAYRTIQKAVDMITPGDDIVIHEGTYDRFAVPTTFQASAANPTIIEGDPNVGRNLIVVDGTGASEAIYSDGGTGSSSRSRFITFRHFNLKAGTSYAINLANEHDDITIQDMYMDGFENTCCRQLSTPHAAAIYVRYGTRIVIEDIKMLGHQNVCAFGICGTDASSVILIGRNSIVRRVASYHFLGSFFGENGADNLIEDNIITDSICERDDGCVQIYNDQRTIVRRNLFYNVTPQDGLSIVQLRGGSTPPSAEIYNNTFIGGTGSPTHLRKKGVGLAEFKDAAGNQVYIVFGPVTVKNNIFVNLGETALSPHIDSGAVSLQRCASPLTIDNNLYFNNAQDLVNIAGCAGAFDGQSIFSNPSLDGTTNAPQVGNAACAGGDSTFVARDGDRSDSYIGAVPCGGSRILDPTPETGAVGPSPTPTPTPTPAGTPALGTVPTPISTESAEASDAESVTTEIGSTQVISGGCGKTQGGGLGSVGWSVLVALLYVRPRRLRKTRAR